MMATPNLKDHANDFFDAVEAIIARGAEREKIPQEALDDITDTLTPLRRWVVQLSEILEQGANRGG